MLLNTKICQARDKILERAEEFDRNPEWVIEKSYCISNEIMIGGLHCIDNVFQRADKSAFFFIGSTQGFYGAGTGLPEFVVHMDRNPAVVRSAMLFRNFLEIAETPQNIAAAIALPLKNLIYSDLPMLLWDKLSAVERSYFLTHKPYLATDGIFPGTSLTHTEIKILYRNLKYHWTVPDTYLLDKTRLWHLLNLFKEQKYQIVQADILGNKAKTYFTELAKRDIAFSLLYFSNIIEWMAREQEAIPLFQETINKDLPVLENSRYIFSHSYQKYNFEKLKSENKEVYADGTKNYWMYQIY